MHNPLSSGMRASSLPEDLAAVRTYPDPLPRGFRLPSQLKQMGEEENCRHRSGWPYVMQYLRNHCDPGGPLLDDFVERSFQHVYSRQQWNEPWVGIFHHPPGLPAWLDETAPLEAITATDAFRASLPWLKGAVALSGHLGEWLERRFGIPVLVLKHPTEIPPVRFSIDAFLDAERPGIVQVGWYARNTRAIYQLDAPAPFQKIHLLQRRPWVLAALDRLDTLSPFRGRPQTGEVVVIDELDNDAYDHLLTRNIVFNEYFAVSASNTIVETIARGVPSLVNRRPAVIEYFGAGYPLLFDNLEQAGAFLRDPKRLTAAAQWIAEIDLQWMDGRQFAEAVAHFVATL